MKLGFEHGQECSILRQAGGRSVAAMIAAVGMIGIWLLIAAVKVDFESFDGYQAIYNARYWLGLVPDLQAQRGPLLPLLIAPAEWWARANAMHPLEVRPHHFVSALLTIAHLIMVATLLSRVAGHGWHTTAAFFATIPTYLFFSYAPFLSQDIIPGSILIAMVVLAQEFINKPSPARWVLLVFLGLLAPLVKQTFSLFWMAIFAAAAITLVASAEMRRIALPRLSALAFGFAVSGVLAWLIYGVMLTSLLPNSPVWARPYEQLTVISSYFSSFIDLPSAFPFWLYIRNMPASGWLQAALIVPGLVLGLRAGGIARFSALVFLLAFIILCTIPFREARYALFLAPLSAVLIAVALRAAAKLRPQFLALLGVIGLVDIGVAISEARQIFTPFYQNSEAKLFLRPLETAAGRPVLSTTPTLTFRAPIASSLAADRYHRFFYLDTALAHRLYFLDRTSFQMVTSLSNAADGSLLLLASSMPVRRVAWSARASEPDDPQFMQLIAVAQTFTFKRAPIGDSYQVSEPIGILGAAFPVGDSGAGGALVFIQDSEIDSATAAKLQPGAASIPASFRAQGWLVSSVCSLRGCIHSDDSDLATPARQ